MLRKKMRVLKMLVNIMDHANIMLSIFLKFLTPAPLVINVISRFDPPPPLK